MNIILKSFDGKFCKEIVEEAFKGLKINTCISIANHKGQWPDLDAKEHEWIPAAPLRDGKYSDIDWDKITPLDRELIEKMRHAEATVLTMLEHYARYRDIPYNERKRQYFEHFRFLNHLLETKKINLVLSNHVPHQCYDYVLYSLCKIKRIPFLFLERFGIIDAFLIENDYEEVGKAIKDGLSELTVKYSDPNKELELSEKFEEFFQKYSTENEDPWYMFQREKHLENVSFMRKWCGTAFKLLFKKPQYLLSSIISLRFWSRKLGQHNASKIYDQRAETPDLNRTYIYVPLHMQPEATTCPMAGAFTDQELLVQLLAANTPKDIMIYVKEHPAQGEMCRNEEFYESMREIPGVKLIHRHFNTFQLTEKALAIATATGTTGLEGMFRGKPVIMFGHRFFQYAPGVHMVRTNKECEDAIRKILEGKELPTPRDMRLFLKAIENCAKPYAGGPTGSYEKYTKEEKAVIMGKEIGKSLHPFFN